MANKGPGILLILTGIAILLAGSAVSTLMIDQVEAWIGGLFEGSPQWLSITFTVLTYLVGLGGLGLLVAGILGLIDLRGVARLVALFALIGIFTGLVLQAIVIIGQGEGEGGWLVDVSFFIGLIAAVLALRARANLAA